MIDTTAALVSWVTAGNVSVGVHYVGRDHEYRPMFLSVLQVDATVVATDVSLRGGVHGSADPSPMLETLVGFLSAWAEAQDYPGSENRDLFADSWRPALPVVDDLWLEVAEFDV